MSDYNDNDDSSKVEELDMDGTPKATQKKKVLSDGYNRPPIIVSYRGEDIDITQKYKNANKYHWTLPPLQIYMFYVTIGNMCSHHKAISTRAPLC